MREEEMMREIKFRAWDKIDKKIMYVAEMILRYKGIQGVILVDKLPSVKVVKRWHDEVELMQYTGIKDKNGREIYEGDIVKTPFGIGEIFMRLGCWFVENQKELGYFESGEIEVVGNVYESSKLLEKGWGNDLGRKRSSKFGVV